MGKFGGFAENSNILHTTDLSCVCGRILFYSLRWTRIFVRNWNRSILRHIVKLLKWANFVVLLKIQIFRILQIWVVFADEFCSTRCAEQGYMWEIEIGAFYEKVTSLNCDLTLIFTNFHLFLKVSAKYLRWKLFDVCKLHCHT